MVHAQLDAVLRQVRGFLAPGGTAGQSDGALLRAFAAANDQAAFAALVERHGPLVLAVCRRVLANAQDAEDAFQATFLLLAQKAASLGHQVSLAGWLHGIAYRTAAHARRAAYRRQRHERRARVMSTAKPECDLMWREVQTVLDEEIQRLPSIYRDTFVLCCLEQRSGAEGARQLGVKEGTVKSRLFKARTMLQQALARRGVSLSAVLAAAALTTNAASAAVSRSLVSATARAAASMAAEPSLATAAASANVADSVLHLVQGVSKSMCLAKIKAVALLILGFCIIGSAGLAVAIHQTLPAAQAAPGGEGVAKSQTNEDAFAQDAPKAEPEAQADRASRSEQAKAVRGRVLDPDGKPLADAKLYLATDSAVRFQFGGGNAPYSGFSHREVAVSGEDGRFEFAVSQKEFAKSAAALPWARSQLIAVAKGYGPDWVKLEEAVGGGELTFRLVKDVPIQGRILTAEGQPVVAARVRVNGISAFAADGLDRYLDLVRKGAYEFDAAKEWRGPVPGGQTEVLTDKEGRCRITGLGRDRLVYLHVAGPAIQHWYVQVMTRNAPAVQGPITSYYGGTKVHGATFEYVAAAARPIRGTVRDKATGKPLAGATIRPSSGQVFTSATARTDEKGSYELLGHPKAARYQFEVRPAAGQIYFTAVVLAKETEGLDPLTVDVDLRPGLPFHGRVLDGDTKQPVAGARVHYCPLLHRRSAERLVYDPAEGLSAATTGADGSFCLATLPGPGVLAVECPGAHPYMPATVTPQEVADFFKDKRFDGALEDLLAAGQDKRLGGIVQGPRFPGLALINPDEKTATSLRQDVIVQRGRTLAGTVVGPDGKPLAGAIINQSPQGGATSGNPPLATASFRLTRLNPRSPRRVCFEHKEKGLALSLVVRGDEPQPLLVRLQPYGSITGRIVDQDGKPVSDVPLRIRSAGHETFFLRARTDREGRFRIDNLAVGDTYRLVSPTNGPIPIGNGRTASFPTFEVEPGKTTDLGNAKVK